MASEPQLESSARTGDDAEDCRSAVAVPGSSAGYRVLATAEVSTDAREDFATAVLQGLSESPKRLPSHFIYDDEGSRLFQEIMGLEEYYPTRCEASILREDGPEILSRLIDGPLNLVDLGAGDGAKTLILLRQLLEAKADFHFVPIDISDGAMSELVSIVANELPEAPVQGLVADYTTALRWLANQDMGRRNLLLFLGSNIGNFDPSSARRFLRQLWASLNPDDFVFIGFDLKKDIEVLLRAYNDSEGVTARFNKNLLTRINRELGGEFDLDRFRHYSTYDVFSGGMESYLVSLEAQSVAIDALHQEFEFQAWEPVHTEYSYKYLDTDIHDLARDTGFVIEQTFLDDRGWFAGSLWRVSKEPL